MTKARTLADNYAADINQVTADAPLTGGGTSGTVTVGIQAGTTAQSGAVQLTDSTTSTSTTTAATPNSVKSAYDLANGAIAKSTIDAKGDLLVGTANDTVSRLAVASTAGFVLTVDSAEATGLKWAAASAGGMTLLSTTTLSGAATNIDNISQSYETLEVWIYGVTNATAAGVFFAHPRNGTTILDTANLGPDGGTSPSGISFGAKVGARLNTDAGDFTLKRTSADNFWVLRISNYASTTNYKSYEIIGGYVNTSDANVGRGVFGHIYSNSAVNSLRFFNSGGDFNSGTVKIYGVK